MKTFKTAVLINMLLVTVFTVVVIVSIWTFADYRKYSSEAETLHEQQLTLRRDLIRKRVEDAKEYISFMRSQTETRLKSLIKNRVNEAYDIADHLYTQYNTLYSEDELKSLLRETLRPIRYNGGSGYYFAVSLDGIAQLHADRPNVEGQSLLSTTDTDGQYVIRDMIDIANTSGEGYYEYTWTKPDMPGNNYRKISYAKLFKPFNWFLGTGIYVDDMEAAIKEEVLVRLESIVFDDGSYLFAGQWDGLSLSGPSKGVNMIDTTDSNGIYLVQKLIDVAKNGGGFVEYVMPDLDGNRSEPKISYAIGIDDWSWYIGTGVYITDIENEFAASKQELTNTLLLDLARNFAILAIFLVVSYLFAQKTAARTVRELNVFNEFFRRSTNTPVMLEEDELKYEEFISLAKSANNMLMQRQQAVDALRESEKKYRLLVDNASEAIVVAQDETLKFVNNYFIEMMEGYSKEELTLKPFSIYIHPDDRDTVFQNYWNAIDDKMLPARHSFRIITKKGITKWVEINVVIIDWEGRPATLNFITDITDKRRVEQELKENELRYRTYISNISDVIAILDKNLTIKYKSPNITRHFGWLPEDLKGNDGWETIHPDDREYIAHELGNLLQNAGSSQTVQYRYLCKDGSYKYIELFAVNMLHDPIIEGILANYRDITEQRNASQALRESEEKFRLAFKTSPDSVNINTIDGTYIEINDGFTRMTGYTEEDVLGKTSTEINIWTKPEDRMLLVKGLKSHGAVSNLQSEFLCKDGIIKTGIMSARMITIQNEPYILSITRDISDRIKLERQLLQAQKIESVGRLAGGIAHDFNNMLGVILGHTEMALDQIDPLQPLHEDLLEIQKAARRSADLTRQLLAFARKQTVAPEVLNLNETVESMLKMLKRLIGENIELSWHPGEALWLVNMDPSQLDQILANLCVNARDAIQGIGNIRIETENSVFDNDYCIVNSDCIPGEFVMLSVSDNGSGMDKETQSKLFEPFYTTKAVGKGTGLGLATVYGIVQQNNGFITVETEPDKGATFRIYFPKYSGNKGLPQSEQSVKKQ